MQYIAIHSKAIRNMALTHIVTSLTHTHTNTVRTKVISRNQAGMRLVLPFPYLHTSVYVPDNRTHACGYCNSMLATTYAHPKIWYL